MRRPVSGPSCSERPSASKSSKDEWRGCIGVEADLDRLPSVGQTAALEVVVRADAHVGPTDINVELPPGLVWVKAPAGFSVGGATAREPERAGHISLAHANRNLRSGATATFTGLVRATQAGDAQIQVRATAKDGHNMQAGEDTLFLTVARQGEPSRAGSAAKTENAAVAEVPVTQRAGLPAGLTPRSVGTAGLPKPTGGDRKSGRKTAPAAGAPCDTTARGNWSYSDQNGVWHNAMNFQVQVWDKDTFSGDDLLAVGVTDSAGNYSLCFDSNTDGLLESGTADAYIRFVSENSIWKVQRAGRPLAFVTGVRNNVSPGSTLDFGALTAADGNLERGLHAFAEANDAWLWVPKPTNLCFDQKDSSCRQLVINWAPDSTDGTYYSPSANDVHLAANDPNAAMTVVHEIGHAVMDDVYNDAFPSAPNCQPHSIQGASSAGCAWTEGWAEWFPVTVYNDPTFRWPSGASLDLENASWSNGWGQGDTTEGRIAGALIDITDLSNEATWDRYGEGPSRLWFTFTHHVSNDLASFWASRAADGFNVADSGALADLYQNTVDYQFRDPLGNYGPLTRPTPTPPHNYGYSTNSIYWSVVATRPPAGSDYDLQLYDNRGQTAYLSGSAYSGSAVDFVAVDSNHRAFGDYYPRVQVWTGSGTYGIELAQGSSSLSAGSSTITMGSANIVSVRDTYITAGTRVTLRVTPTNGGQDPELFLMASNPASPNSWIRPRGLAAATASAVGTGGTEQLTYTAPRSGWYGVVVVNKVGSGNYTLTRV